MTGNLFLSISEKQIPRFARNDNSDLFQHSSENGSNCTPKNIRFTQGPCSHDRLRSFLEYGARFGDVGVKGLDDYAVFFFHDAALEFQSEGERAAVEGKIFGEKREALDGFILREVLGKALDFVFHQSMRARMSGELGIGRKF